MHGLFRFLVFGHERQQTNLQNPKAKETAKQKLRARQQKAATSTPTEAEQPKYRDRASERRVLFNQPDVPLPEASGGNKSVGSAGGSSYGGASTTKRRYFEGPVAPPSPPPAPINPGEDESNIGNKLLKMMGWQAGTGLGIEGEGRVEPMCVIIGVFFHSSKPSIGRSSIILRTRLADMQVLFIRLFFLLQTNCHLCSRRRFGRKQGQRNWQVHRRAFGVSVYGTGLRKFLSSFIFDSLVK